VATLADVIRDNTEQILAEWEAFARGLPMGESMDIAALRASTKQSTRRSRRRRVDKIVRAHR
jgi:hypothetical protein